MKILRLTAVGPLHGRAAAGNAIARWKLIWHRTRADAERKQHKDLTHANLFNPLYCKYFVHNRYAETADQK